MISPRDLGLPPKFTRFRSYAGYDQLATAQTLAHSEYRISGMCAPTGCGKSPCLISTSRLMDASRTLYLTTSKPLQNQLMDDFADSDIGMFSLVGHSSYRCMQSGFADDFECADGRDRCAYWRDVKTSQSRTHITSNIHNWASIALAGDPGRFGKFDLLIIDEAHKLESMLCEILSITVVKRAVSSLLGLSMPDTNKDNIDIWISWAKNAVSVAEHSISEQRRYAECSRTVKLLTRLSTLLLRIAEIDTSTETWIVEAVDGGYKLTPAFAEHYAEEYLFRGIPRVILSSATLTPKDLTYLGLQTQDFDFIDVESGFDPARRPFYYWPLLNVTYETMKIDGCVRQLVNGLDRFIDDRLDRKGITHSVSYAYAERFAQESRHNIITHKSRDAQRVISQFMADPEPGHLASPVLTEGLDFTGEKARYACWWKVPLAYSQDPLTAARKKRDKSYVYYQAGKAILQGYGRLMRDFTDGGECLMRDRGWGDWMIKSFPWPKYFRAAWKRVDSPPVPIKW